MNTIRKFFARPTIKRLGLVFTAAALPLILAAVASQGVAGVSTAVVLSAVIAGVEAVLNQAGAVKAKLAPKH